MFVVVAGSDGSGKTAVAEALVRDVLPQPVLHLHHRPALLPARSRHDGPVTEPHKHQPYPRLLSALKLGYLWVDYLAGWLLRVRPVLAGSGSVVLERGWWDLAVDPRRYRLAPLPWLVRALSWFLPRPDATVVLTAPVDVLLSRKQELPGPELKRQQELWLAAPRRTLRPVFLDADQPLDTVVGQAAARLRPRGDTSP